jgi:hypothetical protein
MIRPPSARLGTITPQERNAAIAASPLKGKYDTAIDAESAYEKLKNRVDNTAPAGTAPVPTGGTAPPGQPQPEQGGGLLGQIGGVLGTIFGTNVPRGKRLSTGQLVTREITRSVTNRVAGKVAADLGKQIGGSMGGTIGRAIVRGTLGGMLRR